MKQEKEHEVRHAEVNPINERPEGPALVLRGLVSDCVRRDGVGHWIVSCNQNLRCKVCPGRAVFKCEKCNVGLHPKCFKDYHTALRL